MMKTTSTVITSLILAMSMTAQSHASETEFELRMHHPGPPGHPYFLGAERFKELVEQKSNGEIVINIYPNNQLASGAKAIQAIQFGTIDVALESTMALSNFVPEVGVLSLPFLFEDRDAAYRIIDGEIGDELKDAAEGKGLKVIAFWDNGFRNISNSVKPVNSPEDLEGLKIRVPESEVFISTFKALGAIPTPMAFSELFTALQLGTVDGQENPSGHLIEYRLFEVQDHFAVTNHIYTAEPLIISTDLFSSMSEDQQSAILEAALEAGEYQRTLTSERADEYLAEIKSKGIQVTQPDVQPFRNAVSSVYERYEEDYGDKIERILSK